MEEKKDRFRIMIVEANDGTKKYSPQKWMTVDYTLPFFLFSWKPVKYIYDWVDFYQIDGKIRTPLSKCHMGIKYQYRQMEDAKKLIELYKIQQQEERNAYAKLMEELAVRTQEEENKKPKGITYIEL